MLQQAGVPFNLSAHEFDEQRAKESYRLLGARTLSLRLAEDKARAAAAVHPSDTIIGSDQTLECQSITYSKPGSLATARSQLMKLRGKTHKLHSAVAVARGNVLLWSHVDSAELTMRNFTESFLDRYLEKEAEHIVECVGAYRIEAQGMQLFDRIEGSHFTILGMPLLPLLQNLRQHGLIPE